MKKVTPKVAESQDAADSIKPSLPETTKHLTPPRSHNQQRPDPVSNVFTIVANVDSESLLCHASENLASLSVMAADLANQLDGPCRNVALAMQQLTVLCELLVNRALDDLDPLLGLSETSSNNRR